MRLLIIGSNGFIGTHLASIAAAHNMEVIALSQSGVCPEGAVQAFAWSFGQPVPETACEGVSCAVHLAHDFNGEAGARLTITSTLAIAAQLQAAGVHRQLFFSSYSAGKHATSLYGRTKFALEEALSTRVGLVIVRPGLVLGDGGIYGRIRKWARKLPLVPLPDGGRGTVPVIKVEILCELTLKLASEPAPAAVANLFEHELKSLRELVLEAASEVNRRPWILPIPGVWLIGILTLAARLHIPLPVNADNLAGFLSNQTAKHISTIV
jgi:nucleoside-diphosphate-sugar epimerase